MLLISTIKFRYKKLVEICKVKENGIYPFGKAIILFNPKIIYTLLELN